MEARTWLLASALLLLVACGGGGGITTTEVEDTGLYRLVWTGTVSLIHDGLAPATLDGVSVGDAVTAVMDWDANTWSSVEPEPGQDPWQWEAPSTGVVMRFSFASGGMYTRTVRELQASATDAPSFDEWALRGSGGDYVFLTRDPTGASLVPPLPSGFPAVSTLIHDTQASFDKSDWAVLFASGDRTVEIQTSDWLITRRQEDDVVLFDPDNPAETDFVFVDGMAGSPGGAGTKADPLDTIQAGITQGLTEGKWVCVAEGIYNVNSDVGTELQVLPGVNVYGGYRNAAGIWTRDIDSNTTTLLDDGTGSAGVWTTVAATQGDSLRDPPVLDGMVIRGSPGTPGGRCVAVRDDSSVTLRYCHLQMEDGQPHALEASAPIVDNTGRVVLEHCLVTGSASGNYQAIDVYRYDLRLADTTIQGLNHDERCWAVNAAYAVLEVERCLIDAGTSTGDDTCALYVNECYPYTIVDSEIRGGQSPTESYALRIMDTELRGGPCTISGNVIEVGTGATRARGIEMEWAEIFPLIEGNTFVASAGAAERFAIFERADVCTPTGIIDNTFSTAGFGPTSGSHLYQVRLDDGSTIVIDDIALLNQCDEPPQDYNPAGTVYGNTLGP